MDNFIILFFAAIDHLGLSFKWRSDIVLNLLVNELLDEFCETFELRAHSVLMSDHVIDLMRKSKHLADRLKSLLWLGKRSCGNTTFFDWSALSRSVLLKDVTYAHSTIRDWASGGLQPSKIYLHSLQHSLRRPLKVQASLFS